MQESTDSVADLVHERLRDAILSAELRPNYRLVEEDLAAWLQVSRTPVREALLRLRQEGLVVRAKGWLVRDHAPKEILQIIQARAAIESATAHLAAQCITTEDLARLEELVDRMEDPGSSRVEINELNNRFHAIITDASGNFLLTQFHRRTKINYWNYNTPVVFTPADDELVNREHRELIAALRAGDSELSERIAREHVGHTARILSAAFGIETG
ncbi:MAG: GntR family transcriptional regulator [Protaetiibacter sp.]